MDFFQLAVDNLRLQFGGGATRCPACGSPVDVQTCVVEETYAPGYHVAGRQLPTRQRATVAAFCSGCEFVLDLRTGGGRDKTSAEMLHDAGEFMEGCRAGRKP